MVIVFLPADAGCKTTLIIYGPKKWGHASITGAGQLLRGHTALIVVAHRLSTVQRADVIHVLDEGRIIASGTFQELRKGSPLVKKYVQLMSFDD